MKKNKGKSRKRWQNTVTVKEESPMKPAPETEENLNFPRNRSLSPFDKFWQEHRHEEKDDKKRRQMDKTMEKYV